MTKELNTKTFKCENIHVKAILEAFIKAGCPKDIIYDIDDLLTRATSGNVATALFNSRFRIGGNIVAIKTIPDQVHENRATHVATICEMHKATILTCDVEYDVGTFDHTILDIVFDVIEYGPDNSLMGDVVKTTPNQNNPTVKAMNKIQECCSESDDINNIIDVYKHYLNKNNLPLSEVMVYGRSAKDYGYVWHNQTHDGVIRVGVLYLHDPHISLVRYEDGDITRF